MTDLTPEALAILDAGREAPKRGGWRQTAVAVAILTLLAGAGGAGLGVLLTPEAAPPAPAQTAAAAPDGAGTVAPGAPQGRVVPLDQILTNIAAPVGTQILLQASLVLDPAASVDEALLATQVQADTTVFVRTLEIAQLEGARGLLHLKEDLLERARIRSPAVIDVAVRSLVLR